jgi:hypothetical protein
MIMGFQIYLEDVKTKDRYHIRGCKGEAKI